MCLWMKKLSRFGCGAAAALFVVVCVAAAPVIAQEKAKKKAAGGDEKRAWIKICEDVKLKEIKEKEAATKKICMTHHESLSARTGQPLVSAAVRKVEGHDKERFLVTVPLGMAIPAGVHVKIDENEPVKFKFSFCHVGGCVAEMELSEVLLKQMKGGAKMIVATMGISGKPVGFPVPLSGFDKAYAGKPIDGKKYATARKAMMVEIRKKQVELAKKAQLEKLKNADKTPKKAVKK